MNKKHEMGQFMTTKYEHILQGIVMPESKHIIEPMAGGGHLLNFINNFERYELFHLNPNAEFRIELYDIDPQSEAIIRRDTINNPPSYKGKFILSNPPYLARNKTEEKAAFDKYGVNDLYKCLIAELIINKPDGGILIIPLNFWSSIRKADIELRQKFLREFNVVSLNIFEETVFDDTTITVCSFLFEMRRGDYKDQTITAIIYPQRKLITGVFNPTNNFMYGGEIYNLNPTGKYTISRLTKDNIAKQNTHLLIKCIDDSAKSKISLTFVEENKIFVDNTPNLSARTYATLIIEPSIDEEKQKQVAEYFNAFLEDMRNTYQSLFLSNYRESKDISRKRISFDLVYNIVEKILDIMDSE